MNKLTSYIVLCMMALLMVSCERVVFDESQAEQQATDGDGVLVTFRVSELDGSIASTNETRAEVDVADVCTRLNFVVYQSGSKVKGVNQSVDDDDFGTATMKLDAGTYQLLVVGHSGKENPTLSNPSKIVFSNKNAGFTDTFYYYGTLVVGTDEGQTHNITLQRAVTMFRLVITDAKPANVTRMKITFKSGSSGFDATTGLGNVNSTNLYTFYEVADWDDPITLEAYNFLHAEEEDLDIFVQSFSADGVEQEREFTGVPMKRNYVTQYSGPFFTASGGDGPVSPDTPNPDDPDSNNEGQLSVKVDATWGGQNDYTF